MRANPHIFRKYDIRGIAAEDLTDEVVEAIGRAYGTRLVHRLGSEKGAQVGVGFDARDSSPRLFEAVARGLNAVGVDVLALGLVPTPLAYFANSTIDGVDGVIQITGSHNPAEYNGFKMMMGPETLHGDAIEALRAIILDDAFHQPNEKGTRRELDDLKERYITWVADNVQPGERSLRVVLDSGNGVAGVVAPDLVRRVFPNAEVIELFSEPDATFPNHHPDPTVEENLEALIAAVREHDADLGVAYDGDGDRIGVVDERGDIIWGDRLMILLSRAVLAEYPGATIIGEVKCSQTLFDDIHAHGGEPVMARVGHSLIKAKIKETGAKLAGEMSGHIFFNDRFFGFDDALYTTCRLLEILSNGEGSLSGRMSDVPTTFVTPEIRLDCDETLKFSIPESLADRFGADYDVTTIDGARIHFDDGWGLVRASNTQPVLVLRVEASSAQARDRRLGELKQAIAELSR